MKTKEQFCFFAVCLFLALAVALPAQTAAELDELLETEALDYGEVARFVFKAADIIEPDGMPGDSGKEEAFNAAIEKGWLPKSAAAAERARLDGVSLLIMRAFDIKGNFLFTLFKNPHYAYRELAYLDVIQGRSDPAMAVSGDTLLFMVNRIIAMKEEAGIAPVEESIQPTAEQQALVMEINAQLSARAVSGSTVRITQEGVTISVSNIQFGANSAELPDSEKQKLVEIAEILKVVSQRMILVTGHTALAGTEEDRLKTSQDRASAVAAYLISLGARRSEEVFAQGFGSERPIADNSTPQGMALNRRVEITILEDQR